MVQIFYRYFKCLGDLIVVTDLQVKCFLAVAMHLSFTKAARGLFISQSNISRQIASFEEELGLSLFDRNTKGVRLTVQGQMLAETLSQMTNEWENALERARNSVRRFSGSISIGCQEHVKANSYISQVLSGFREGRPEIQIIKERCTQRKLVEGLLNDYYDAILIADHDVRLLPGLEMFTLFYSRLVIVIHENHPFFPKKDLTAADFKDCPFLRYLPLKQMKPEDDYLFRICGFYGFVPNVQAEYEDFEEFLLAIELGEGASMVFEEEVVTTNTRLRVIPIEEEVSAKYMPMQLVRREKNKNPAMSDFCVFARRYSELHAKKDF